jgi:hypothetical protein
LKINLPGFPKPGRFFMVPGERKLLKTPMDIMTLLETRRAYHAKAIN